MPLKMGRGLKYYLFFKKYIYLLIYLAVWGLSHGTWNLSLRCVNFSLVDAPGSEVAVRASLPRGMLVH